MAIRTLAEIEDHVRAICNASDQMLIADFVAPACAWLHACGYQGLDLLREALADEAKQLNLVRDALGLDLKNVSCVFIAPALQQYTTLHGRVFLRNVKHGLYLVPDSVNRNYGIGCPVDPSFAFGGERNKNPYIEKLAAAKQHGVEIDNDKWHGVKSTART